MTFAFLRAESLPWIESAGTDAASPATADRAVAALRADYERWSRWWLGVLAYLCAAAGVVVVPGMMQAIAELSGPVAAIDVIVVIAGAVLAVVGVVLLVRLWRSGRRLTTAASWWLRLPYAAGVRQRNARGWVEARTVIYEPRVFVRIATSALTFLLGVSGCAVVGRDVVDGFSGLTLGFLGIGVLSLACCGGQAAGVLRVVSGLAEADPLWVRIRDSFSGS